MAIKFQNKYITVPEELVFHMLFQNLYSCINYNSLKVFGITILMFLSCFYFKRTLDLLIFISVIKYGMHFCETRYK